MSELETIEVAPGSELDRLLDLVTDAPLWLVRNSARFRLERVREESRPDYDPERARAGMNAAVGTWPGLDAEVFKEYFYRGREAGTHPADRQICI